MKLSASYLSIENGWQVRLPKNPSNRRGILWCMWRILQMWEMTTYFAWHRNHLASIHRIADPEIEKIAREVSPVFAGMIAVHKRKEKTTVAKQIFCAQFVLNRFVNYWFTQDRKRGAASARLMNFPKHLKSFNEVFEDCFKQGYFEESREHSNYFFITFKGEVFGESPIGLLVEELKYIGSIPLSLFKSS